METLEDIRANIETLAPGHVAEFEGESLIVYENRNKELRIKQTNPDKFRVATREHNAARFEEIGGGKPTDFSGVLGEIRTFASAE